MICLKLGSSVFHMPSADKRQSTGPHLLSACIDADYKKKVDEERRKRKPKEEDPKLFGSIIIPLPK